MIHTSTTAGFNTSHDNQCQNASSEKNDNHTEKVKNMRQILFAQSTNVSSSSSSNNNDNNHTSSKQNGWDELWKQKITPWDIGRQTPVLISELKQLKQHQFCHNDNYQIRSLIPGCGGGYDLVTIAKYQHEYLQTLLVHENNRQSNDIMIQNCESSVIGLDISPTSLSKATEIVQSLLKEQQNQEIQEQGDENEDTRTNVHLALGDFFASPSTWVYQSSIPYQMLSPHGKGNASSQTHITDYNKKSNKNNSISTDYDMKFDLIFD
jgi:SAM-dependent methyltransferase